VEEKVCHCADNSDRLSGLSYAEPAVASSSSGPFPADQSPSPIPVPPPVTTLVPAEFPVPSSEASDSDKENSSPRSVESAQPLRELVKIEEIDDEEARLLSDAMDAEVRSKIFKQRCRSNKHPARYHPFPKDWRHEPRRSYRKSFMDGAEAERRRRTKFLIEGFNGDADVETDDESESSRG